MHQLILAAADPTVAPGVVDTVESSATNLLPILLTLGGAGIVVAVSVIALKGGFRAFLSFIPWARSR